jgi:hypothetical protein
MGSVQINIAQVHSFGNVALVHTVEVVGEGTALKSAVRRQKGDPAHSAEKVRCATTCCFRSICVRGVG